MRVTGRWPRWETVLLIFFVLRGSVWLFHYLEVATRCLLAPSSIAATHIVATVLYYSYGKLRMAGTGA